LLLVSICFLTSYVHAVPAKTTQEQANSILNNVLGINNIYSTDVNSQENTKNNGLTQSTIDYRLASDQGSVRVSASFINNSLNMLYLTEYNGALATSHPSSSTGKMAADFLKNYQTFTGNSFYGTLFQTLNDVSGETSITKSVGDITLKVQNTAQATVDYVWTYTDANGINAETKNVVLSYYNGNLNCFLDNWRLYNVIGSPKISCEQAIEIALASVQNYNYQVTNGTETSTVLLSGFKVAPESLAGAKLSYVNCPNASLARDGNSYNLYSSWWIPIGFDKFYPGDVTGIAVTVWADTGKVGSIELMYADSNFANAYTSTIQPTISVMIKLIRAQ
jgi:hypothetical protein